MIIAIIYILLSYVIFDQQLVIFRLEFEKIIVIFETNNIEFSNTQSFMQNYK